MHLSDKKSLSDLLEYYSMGEILAALSELAVVKASQMSDWELSDTAKKWSEVAISLQFLSDVSKL